MCYSLESLFSTLEMSSLVPVYVCVRVIFFLLVIHVGIELLGHRTSICLDLVDVT